jgi:prophage regulatory protein
MSDQVHHPKAILRRKKVEARTGLSRSTIYDGVKAGTFPPPISLGAKAVGWLESEIEDWISCRVQVSRKTVNGERDDVQTVRLPLDDPRRSPTRKGRFQRVEAHYDPGDQIEVRPELGHVGVYPPQRAGSTE